LPAAGAVNTAVVSFKDSEGVDVSSEWQFVITYLALDPASRVAATGKQRGFSLHVVQAPIENSPLENSLDRAETQLAVNSPIPRVVDTNAVVDVINLNKRSSDTHGVFPDDLRVPGIDPDTTGNGDNDFAVEILTYLELPAGVHRFGANTDDGFKIASGIAPLGASTPPLSFHNGGSGSETFDFVVSQAGFYAFRMVWYERGGGAHVEWFSENMTTGARTLINDPSAPAAVKAYVGVEETVAVVLQATASLTAAFADETTATIDPVAKRVTVPMTGTTRFYRLLGPAELTITSMGVEGANVVLTYE
jgi:hypothetical protein